MNQSPTIANSHTNSLSDVHANKRKFKSTIWITTTALFMAMNIAFSSYGIPVPGGHFYLCDIVICTAALLLDPFSAFIVGGVGSFLGDMFFYPLPMFVSLVTHGIQAFLISYCTRNLLKKHQPAGAVIGLLTGMVVMVAGYTFGRAFIYSTKEYAIMKLPYEFLQAGIGVIGSMILCYPVRLKKLFHKFMPELND